MGSSVRTALALAVLIGGTTSCAVRNEIVQSSALDFLYPSGTEPVAPTDVTLNVPVRVGLAFAPSRDQHGRQPLSEGQRRELLESIATAFRDHESVRSVEVIPTTYLTPGGSFENLDRLAVAFGVDLMALVSYEQAQYSASTARSWTYWTLVGAYIVKGEKNETRTMLDAVVYDIRSRTLLFRASGENSLGGASTPIGMDRDLKDRAEESMRRAGESLVADVGKQLEVFSTHARSGTVRGIGTPAIEIVRQGQAAGGGGSGSSGVAGILLAAVLAGGPALVRSIGAGSRTRPSRRAPR